MMLLSLSLAGWGLYTQGKRVGVEQEQEKAIEAGVGEWQIHPKSGEKNFAYRTPTQR